MIDLTDSPRDYDLPSDAWYPNQKQMAQSAVNNPVKSATIIEGPTGTGKSFCPGVTSFFRPGTVVITGTRDLQSQYADTIPFFRVVWGQEHYPCVLDARTVDFEKTYGFPPTRADCPLRYLKECPSFSTCPYEVAKREALAGRAMVLNVAYAFCTNWWKHGRGNWDLFIDEAHRMPDALSDLISVTVSKQVRRRYDLPDFPDITEKGERRQKAISLAHDWLGHAVSIMDRWCNVKDEVKAKRAERFRGNLEMLYSVLSTAEMGTWYIESNPELFSCKPVIPGIYASRLITPEARSLTFMSATIGDPQVLMTELGLDDVPMEFTSLPHAFPQSNRPVFWLKDAPRIRARTTDTEYKYQAELISKIINQHKGEKGLIHTASWQHARKLMELLSSNGIADRMFLAEGKRIETVEKFKASPEGTVAISPSWHEGLNFPDEECRFCVISKTPFLSLGDPIVRLRIAQKGGNDWYKWKAALQVCQAAGRGVRHAKDYCVTYIVDGTYPQVHRFAPKWFNVEAL